MRELILSVEDLLARREWTGAAGELQSGDDQYRDGHWIDAVREYYSALESGLKHRLDKAICKLFPIEVGRQADRSSRFARRAKESVGDAEQVHPALRALIIDEQPKRGVGAELGRLIALPSAESAKFNFADQAARCP